MNENRLLTQYKIKDKLKFNDDHRKITLDSNRMLLIHAEAFSHLKNELFNSLEPSVAQGLLLRTGFTSGQIDADIVLNSYESDKDFDALDLGPAIHGLEGFVHAQIVEHEIDWEKGSFHGQVICSGSVEAERYLHENNQPSDCPVCWSVVGYASGYASRFFKRFIVFKEVQCKACGDEHCVLVGKPVEAWGDDSYINYFKANYEDKFPLEHELTKLRGQRPAKQFEQGDLLGQSKEFIKAFEFLTHAANTPINVLLQGETGVGKEVFARWLHRNSERQKAPFVAINCGAIPNDLIEAELFGVKRGAYTGASESRPGRFEQANGGTLFLDELGELSPSAQVKLLRVLQTGELERLGDTQTVKVDVRLVAATNVNLQQAIKDGDFRSDLYYRIATYPIEIPPLRNRKTDIPILVDAMIKKFAPLYRKSIKGINKEAMSALIQYEWPGNIRELQNIIERAVLLVPDDNTITSLHLELSTQESHSSHPHVAIKNITASNNEDIYKHLLNENISLQEYEINLIKTAMASTNGNMTQAAKLLGISRRQITYKLKSAQP